MSEWNARQDLMGFTVEKFNHTYADEDVWQSVMAEAAVDALVEWLRENNGHLCSHWGAPPHPMGLAMILEADDE